MPPGPRRVWEAPWNRGDENDLRRGASRGVAGASLSPGQHWRAGDVPGLELGRDHLLPLASGGEQVSVHRAGELGEPGNLDDGDSGPAQPAPPPPSTNRGGPTQAMATRGIPAPLMRAR